MKNIVVLFLALAFSPVVLSSSICPDKHDITHGLNTQKKDFHRGNEIYLAGSNWLIEETQTFKHSAECPQTNFFDNLHCHAKNRKLRFMRIPQRTNLCKYQIYIVDSTGVFAEFSLRPLMPAIKKSKD